MLSQHPTPWTPQDVEFWIGGPTIAVLLIVWGYLYWKGYPYTRTVAFRSMPFVLIIILFTLGFAADPF